MGLLRDIERRVRHTVRDIARDPIGGAVRQLDPNVMASQASTLLGGGYQARPEQENTPAGPELRRQEILKRMREGSERFRESLPRFKLDQERGILPTYGQALEEGQRRTKENFSRRGLLQSGLRRRAETQLRGEATAQLKGAKRDISQGAESLANQMEMASLQETFDSAAQMLQSSENLYNIQQQNLLARRQAFGQLAAGVGYGVGSYAAAKSSPYSSQASRDGMLTSAQYGSGQLNYNLNLPTLTYPHTVLGDYGG